MKNIKYLLVVLGALVVLLLYRNYQVNQTANKYRQLNIKNEFVFNYLLDSIPGINKIIQGASKEYDKDAALESELNSRE